MLVVWVLRRELLRDPCHYQRASIRLKTDTVDRMRERSVYTIDGTLQGVSEVSHGLRRAMTLAIGRGSSNSDP